MPSESKVPFRAIPGTAGKLPRSAGRRAARHFPYKLPDLTLPATDGKTGTLRGSKPHGR